MDSSNRLQRQMLTEILSVLSSGGYLVSDVAATPASDFVERAIEQGVFDGTRAVSLVEFGRTLHAEMNAILDAARHGVSMADCTLFTTTFPCHECTRHIIGAGISRVVYVHPYPKSLADNLHPDAISFDGPADGKVVFEPFIGVAPRRFEQMFSMRKRKDDADGTCLPWTPTTSRVVAEDRWGPVVARAIETFVLNELWDHLEGAASARSAEPSSSVDEGPPP